MEEGEVERVHMILPNTLTSYLSIYTPISFSLIPLSQSEALRRWCDKHQCFIDPPCPLDVSLDEEKNKVCLPHKGVHRALLFMYIYICKSFMNFSDHIHI